MYFTNLLPDFKDTITVFTPFDNPILKQTVWYKYVIDKCFYSHTDSSSFGDKALFDDNTTFVRIPKLDNYKGIREWNTLPSDEKQDYLSFNNRTLVFLGKIDDNIPDGDSGNTLIKKMQPDCFHVNTIKDNTGKIPYVEHYYLSGA
jgi:hypothetical protein